MTRLSFRVDAADAQRWATALGVDRSELLREALRRHLDRLGSEGDADRWLANPLVQGERALAEIGDWGPAEDWSDWVDAARCGPRRMAASEPALSAKLKAPIKGV